MTVITIQIVAIIFANIFLFVIISYAIVRRRTTITALRQFGVQTVIYLIIVILNVTICLSVNIVYLLEQFRIYIDKNIIVANGQMILNQCISLTLLFVCVYRMCKFRTPRTTYFTKTLTKFRRLRFIIRLAQLSFLFLCFAILLKLIPYISGGK